MSSFARFARHDDEQRLDVFEGACTVYNINREGEGQTFMAGAQVGTHCYVLSTVMRHSPTLMEEFADGGKFSYIRINNTTGFAFEVAKKLAQAEYRFVWQVSEECTGTTIVSVPDARQHCSKASLIDRPRKRPTKRGIHLPPVPGTTKDRKEL